MIVSEHPVCPWIGRFGRKHSGTVQGQTSELQTVNLTNGPIIGPVNKKKNNFYIQRVNKMADDEQKTEHINLKVAGQDGSVVQFKIKKVN